MPSLKRRVREAGQRLGLDLQRYPTSDPLWGVVRMLQHRGIDTVLDVGANDGGFASSLRRLGYRGHIHSFEPVGATYARLAENSRHDASWTSHRHALGDQTGELDIHVAGNQEASSSFLAMGQRHVDAAPESAYVATEKVQVRRLDDVVDEIPSTERRSLYLKIDVQGYEAVVLEGARRTLAERLSAVQMELSLVPLYDGAMTWREGLARMDDRGFRLASVQPGFRDRATGELLQFDAVFVRDE